MVGLHAELRSPRSCAGSLRFSSRLWFNHREDARYASFMDILILGGTGFLGPHLVEQALAKGWKLTLFNRGKTDPKLFAAERYKEIVQLRGDRDPNKDEGLKSLEAVVAERVKEGRPFDAVIDNSGYFPRIAKASAELVAPATQLYMFVSTISVYTDNSIAPDESTAVGTMEDPTTEAITGESYGPLKALCEQAAELACKGKTTVVRPGLIVGPGDDSLRFSYWPVRVAEGGKVLAPKQPDPYASRVQFIDVRDLAQFMLKLVEDGHTGTYIANGPAGPLSMEEMLAGMKASVSDSVEFVWADEAWLLEQGVDPWMGLPLWIPQGKENDGVGRANCAKAFAHGLQCRPLAQTSADTIADFEAGAAARPTTFAWGSGRAPSISRVREAELIAAWNARAPIVAS
ncbi:MAG: NAD-dependent epimerase/dehydratase family protein [Phycisphaerales bacterium]|nr:NAD-dependent epimerase/dehydratase family protein [Phycisphaerales bacterium]